jgi:hypothetical protein
LRLIVGFLRQQNLRSSSDQYFSQFPIIQTWSVNFFRASQQLKKLQLFVLFITEIVRLAVCVQPFSSQGSFRVALVR